MSSKGIYFQSQGMLSMNCGVHCLNNFLGRKRFTETDFNKICSQLSDKFFNPHKHIFGGDYDINILMLALQQINYDIEYMDMRKQIKTQDQKQCRIVHGYILNQVSTGSGFMQKLGKLFSSRHWICIKQVHNNYWLFDSKLNQPKWIGNDKKLKEYLEYRRNQGDQICKVFQSFS